MKNHLLVFIVALSCASRAAPAAEDFVVEEGFTRWDNGRDLTGWYASKWSGEATGDPRGWSVVEGAIHLDFQQATSHLFCERKHSRNAIVRLQFRASEGADSGLAVHGNQFQVRDYPNSHPDTRRYAPVCRPAGEWNDLELDICEGVAVIRLNGQVIEPAWKIGESPERGLGLQREVGDFDFRYIRVKEK